MHKHHAYEPCSIWALSYMGPVLYEPCSIWALSYMSTVQYEHCPIWALSNMSTVLYEPCSIWALSYMSTVTVLYEPCPIWALSYMGPVLYGPCSIWALSYMGPVLYEPCPIWALSYMGPVLYGSCPALHEYRASALNNGNVIKYARKQHSTSNTIKLHTLSLSWTTCEKYSVSTQNCPQIYLQQNNNTHQLDFVYMLSALVCTLSIPLWERRRLEAFRSRWRIQLSWRWWTALSSCIISVFTSPKVGRNGRRTLREVEGG